MKTRTFPGVQSPPVFSHRNKNIACEKKAQKPAVFHMQGIAAVDPIAVRQDRRTASYSLALATS
jgi:hypothetical protein